MDRFVKRIAWILVLALGAGCTKEPPPIVPAAGVLLLNGEPLGKAEIRLYPQEKGLNGDFIAIAVTDDNGKFTLQCNGQPGACAGVHQVTVGEGPPPKDARGESAKAQQAYTAYAATLKNRPIPPRYATLAESPLTLTIVAGTGEYKIELSR